MNRSNLRDSFEGLGIRTKGRRSLCRIVFLIPALFIATVVVALLVVMGEPANSDHPHYLKYSTVTGYFLQDDPATNHDGFDYAATNFGLINREYDTDADFDPDHKKSQWQRFENQVTKLNHDSDHSINYKVLFMGRHGEGYHNVAERFYGTKAWDCYWSLQDGNATSNWVDALLTPAGIAEAEKANKFWGSLLKTQKIPAPESYYSSPMRRCCATTSVTFSGLDLPKDRPFVPTVKELFREVNGAHTCDKRSSKSVIHKAYPTFVFENGFQEEDLLWRKDERETAAAQDIRTKVVLDDVFSSDKNTWISISSHSGEISSLLRVLGHREFGLGTGQIIPVLVKAEKIQGTPPPVKDAPWDPVTSCAEPPAARTLL